MSAKEGQSSASWNMQQNNAAEGSLFRTGFLSTLSSNPTMTRSVNPSGLPRSAKVVCGLITRIGAGTNDCTLLAGNRFIGCSFASPLVSHTFGYSFAALPVEGSYAVAVVTNESSAKGVVIAILPYGNWTKDNSPVKVPSQELNPYKPHGYSVVSAYRTPVEDPKFEFTVNSWSNRPSDVVPGEFCILNEHRAGLRLGPLSAEIRGGGAFVRAERLDDEVRIGSTTFTIWSALDCFRSMNDRGYISGELRESSYQGERLGLDGLSASSEASVGSESNPRVKEFRGYLGGQRSTFFLRPKTPSSPEEGVATEHVSESGKILTRSASGISMELYDKIPVPKRVMEYWDPKGNRDDAKHEAKTPFDFGADPHTVAMKAYDAIAWNQRNDYLHFDGYDKDFDTPEEGDIDTPGDSDRDPSSSRDDLRKNSHRRAGLHIMPDGSVIIRDAWGSEIVLSGGNVYINTCGSILSTAHKDTVIFSGDSSVMKSRDGTVTAESSNGVVEIHGGRHVTMVGGTDGADVGGVLIESLGSGDGTVSTEVLGTKSTVNGVVVKSMKSGVAIEGKNIFGLGEDNIRISTGKDGDKRTGSIVVSTNALHSSFGASATFMSDGGDLRISPSGIVGVTKGGISLLARKDVTIVQNKKYLGVPQWVPVKKIDETIDGMLDNYGDMNEFLQSSEIMSPYDWASFRDSILAVMGRSEDYHTTVGTEPYVPSSSFTMYQPSWHWLRSKYPELIVVSPEKWNQGECKVNGSNAWPGKSALEGGRFVVMGDNPNLDGNGYSKSRSSLKDSCETEDRSISEFEL